MKPGHGYNVPLLIHLLTSFSQKIGVQVYLRRTHVCIYEHPSNNI